MVLSKEKPIPYQPPLPPNEAPSGVDAAAGVTPVGLRPPFVTPAAAHSHPDCRGIPILIVAPQSTQTFAATVVVAADAGWQIRIAAGAAEMMSTLLRQHSPNETGGILVGRIAAPRKTIYVTRLVPAPPDSRGTPWIFTRGTRELPEALEKVHRRTGGLMTYVGEWHTHPMGGSDLSETDKGAVISLRSILDEVGRPTLVTIVTPDEIRPHLFEPTSPPVVLDPPRRRFGIIRVVLGWRR